MGMEDGLATGMSAASSDELAGSLEEKHSRTAIELPAY